MRYARCPKCGGCGVGCRCSAKELRDFAKSQQALPGFELAAAAIMRAFVRRKERAERRGGRPADSVAPVRA